jgi:hypothetical protein
MSDHPVSPEVRDKLARQLQENLKRRRPRTRLWLLLALPLLAAALYGLWQLSKMPPPLPPLMLVVYDALESDGLVAAQLVAPGSPDTGLEGLDVHWKLKTHDETATTKTDRNGAARYQIAAGDDRLRGRDKPLVHVSFIDPAGAYRRDKSVALATLEMFGDEIVIVPIDKIAERGEAIDWAKSELANLPRALSRSAMGVEGHVGGEPGEKCWVIYASGEVDWPVYQRMREWLQRHQGKADDQTPLGPLLRETAEAIERRLRERLGAERVRVWQPGEVKVQ